MLRVYKPVGPSANKAETPDKEVKKNADKKNDGKKAGE